MLAASIRVGEHITRHTVFSVRVNVLAVCLLVGVVLLASAYVVCRRRRARTAPLGE